MIIRCLYDKLVPILELKKKFHPKNRNKHPDDQIQRLAEILNYQGIRYPAKISNQSDCITSGHGRILAAEYNGWTEFPVNYQGYDNPDMEYADVQADNAIAAWSELDLSLINTDVANLMPDFDIKMLGMKDFKVEPIDKLEPQCDEDAVPDVKESFVKLGDIWQLGNHRLMCGDSTSIDAVENLMNGEKADITFTSPPYNMGVSTGGSGKHKRYNTYSDDLTQEEYSNFLCSFTAVSKLVSKYQFINLQFLSGNRIGICDWLAKNKEYLVDVMCWDKGKFSFPLGYSVLSPTFELFFIFSPDLNPNRAIHLKKFSSTPTMIKVSPGTDNENADIHSATFKVELPEYFIDTFLESGHSVFDPFGGTGSTLIACEKTNRKCFMSELDPHYCAVIVERWQKYTGNKAERIIDGQAS